VSHDLSFHEAYQLPPETFMERCRKCIAFTIEIGLHVVTEETVLVVWVCAAELVYDGCHAGILRQG
jgi:hypothetical protein